MNFPAIFAAGFAFAAALAAGTVWLYGRTHRPVTREIPTAFPPVQVISVRVIPGSPEEVRS